MFFQEGMSNRGAPGPQPMPMEDPEAPGYMRKMGSPPGITGQYGPSCYEREVQDRGLVDLSSSHSPTAIDRLD